MAVIDPDEDPLELETEEFREIYAEDPTVADLVHAAVLAEHPERPALADAVVDSLVAGHDMHEDEAPIVEILDACLRLMPLDAVVEHLRGLQRDALADLLEATPAEAGRWLHEGGWAVHDDAGTEVAFMFARRDSGRAWVQLFDGTL
ncbi:hypothetical protein QQX10_06225 [Demequina sp. SYSU T00039]|uniref:Uncharacterized protein n=1 Tax=Demequina lignilytica TaxID=3051663 RepID=A0AAW7M976_9MICO|nr:MULTISPECIES: hypothetical protein [unclassified Demequina]MDN4477853.1 hypothetical protein [Demequina sp. SYSU T00039-1]MDN4487762.1 hypothetical protein [Demequina sp. SYSU T00039]MDN4490855.1 hypothetical protein [Demequina sp. SYSU T00068]